MRQQFQLTTITLIIAFFSINNAALAQDNPVLHEAEFSEPIFEDNIGEFYGEPGSFEFNFVPVLLLDKGENLLEVGGEIETNLAPKLGAEIGFAHSWLELGDEATTRQEYTYLEVGLQYLLAGNRNRLWAIGAETRTPSLVSLTDEEGAAWVTEPFVLMACRFGSGFNGQFRPSLELAWLNEGAELEAGFTGSLFHQGEVFLLGLEAGISVEEEGSSFSFAPQLGIELGNFDLGFGVNLPLQLSSKDGQAPYLLARVVYELEFGD